MKDTIVGVLLYSIVAVVMPGVQLRTRNDTSLPTNKACAFSEYASSARCTQTRFRLICTGGVTSFWIDDVRYEITHLRMQEWPGECFNIGRLQYHFPELRMLEFINCTELKIFKGYFDETSKIEKISMHGLPLLWEIPPDVFVRMRYLRELDLRRNQLRHMKSPLLIGPPSLERVHLSGNSWDCSDSGLDWLAMESENGTARLRIADYYELVCYQKLYRGKPLHKVMDIIKTMKQTCPEPCVCNMTHVVSDRNGAVIPLITVNCAKRQLEEPPPTLPPSTTTLRLEGNKINTIKTIIQNPHYMKLADLYLDNNSISAVKELEGSEWFSKFRVLSLRGNMIQQIPVYAFDKAFQMNFDIMHVFLGHNPWRCDCHYTPRFQRLLIKYRRVIRDVADIKCAESNDKTSLAQISKIPLGIVCAPDSEMPISTVNIINIVLFVLILLVVGKFLYDWHIFKSTGKLPWISSVLPW